MDLWGIFVRRRRHDLVGNGCEWGLPPQIFFPVPPWPDFGKEGRVFLTARVIHSGDSDMFSVFTEEHVLLSEDAGRNWVILDGLDRFYGSAPVEDGTIYVGGKIRDGVSNLLVSRDGGATWQERKLPFMMSGIHFDLAAPEWMFAEGYVQSGYWIYVSSDSGATWSQLPISGNVLHVDGAQRLLFLSVNGEIKVYQWEEAA